MARGGGRGRGGRGGGVEGEVRGRRGVGHRKHGVERWATHWMNDNFDYWDDRQEIQRIQGGATEGELDAAIEECEEYLEKWEDIAYKMGGTVFLDVCERLAWVIVEMLYRKIKQFENQLQALLEEEEEEEDE